MTIYTSKKTGATYTMQTLSNGKFQLTSTEDPKDVITTTESMIKRWYKKSLVVDFTKAAPAPTKKSHHRSAYASTKTADGISKGSFLPFYPNPKMSIQVIGLDFANTLFPEMKLDYNTARLSSTAFRVPRRAYINTVTGNVGIRFSNQLFEIDGLKAYAI